MEVITKQFKNLNIFFKLLLVVGLVFYIHNFVYIFKENITVVLNIKETFFASLKDKSTVYFILYPFISTAGYVLMLLFRKVNMLTVSLISIYNISFIAIDIILTILYW